MEIRTGVREAPQKLSEREARFRVIDEIRARMPQIPAEEAEADIAEAIAAVRKGNDPAAVDTSVLVSSVLVPTGVPAKVVDAWRALRFIPIVTPRQFLTRLEAEERR